MGIQLQRLDDDKAALSGDLLNTTVVSVIDEGKQLLKAAGDVWSLDMAQVERVSSAGVALLLEWLRTANQAGKTLKIDNLPEHIQPIISVSDLNQVFDPLLA